MNPNSRLTSLEYLRFLRLEYFFWSLYTFFSLFELPFEQGYFLTLFPYAGLSVPIFFMMVELFLFIITLI